MAPRTLLPASCLLLLMAACGGKEGGGAEDTSGGAGGSGGTEAGGGLTDEDGDGWSVEAGDCDDADPEVFPGQVELCDGDDDNCNEVVDEGHPDSDNDLTADCLDEEECDGIDNNGDGQVDEGLPDTDGDGTLDCFDEEECDGIDNNGDGTADEGFDADADGYSPCAEVSEVGVWDCDDDDASLSPGAAETDGDEVDNDCDHLIDETSWLSGASLVINEIMKNPRWTSDVDGEWIEIYNAGEDPVHISGLMLRSESGEWSYIAADVSAVLAPGGYAVIAASEDSEGVGGEIAGTWQGINLNNEADTIELWAGDVQMDAVSWDVSAGWPDDGGTSMNLDEWYQDSTDNDSADSWCATTEGSGAEDLGTPGLANEACPTIDRDGDGFSLSTGDCDDADPAVSPDAVEVPYDGADNDCDEATLEDDLDEDGFVLADDCDDTDASDFPLELYPDLDLDTYGDASATAALSCTGVIPGLTTDNSDCDDTNASTRPGATEITCDGIDNNCDGADAADVDRDGFDALGCGGDDCNDSSDTIHPYALERTDGVDNDCDSLIDSADTDPQTNLSLSDDSSSTITFSGGFTFPFCGSNWSSAYVISNGRVMFGSADTTYTESVSTFSTQQSIAFFWDDLVPTYGGQVIWVQHTDAVAVHFVNIGEISTRSPVNASVVMMESGRIYIEYGNVGPTDGLMGWSCGGGTTSETDISAAFAALSEGNNGIGSGTEDAIVELFTGSTDPFDLDNYNLMFCVNSGSDLDGDGYTDECGDTDDTDATVHP
jgi:Lamin Tail Domain/Putative metal-binding motif